MDYLLLCRLLLVADEENVYGHRYDAHFVDIGIQIVKSEQAKRVRA